MPRIGAVCIAALTAALLMSTSAALAVSAADGPGIAEANALATSVNKVAPVAVDNPRLALARDGGMFRGNSTRITVGIPTDLSGQVSLESLGSASPNAIRVSLPAAPGSNIPVVAGDGTIIFNSQAATTGVAVQAFDQGVRIHVVLKSIQSDSEFSYLVSVPAGGKIQTLENGGLALLQADRSLVGGFAAPWAKDSDGNSVPTHYEIRSNTVVQIVEHKTGHFKYPIVADPYLGINLIDHAQWVYHSGYGYTLQVTPTWWARANAGSYVAGSYGWDELYARYHSTGLSINLNGMRDQYICHQVFVAVRDPRRATWNIDEWRPDVGWLQTVNSSCNPGGPVFFD